LPLVSGLRRIVTVARQTVASVPVADGVESIEVAVAASMPVEAVLPALNVGESGLTSQEAGRRLRLVGRNAVRTHRAGVGVVLWRQLRSPLLLLLAVTASTSFSSGSAPTR